MTWSPDGSNDLTPEGYSKTLVVELAQENGAILATTEGSWIVVRDYSQPLKPIVFKDVSAWFDTAHEAAAAFCKERGVDPSQQPSRIAKAS